jgi:DNA polymerase V
MRKISNKLGLAIHPISITTQLELPFVAAGIKAGFPSPAMDFIDVTIDLNKHLIKHPSSTFYGKVKGDSMKNLGIHDEDILIIDKSLKPESNKIAVCVIDGEFTLKQIRIEKTMCWLIPANEDYQPIRVTEDNDFLIWGIVTYVIKSFNP